MNGIDISKWNPGINFNVVPSDFVIVKATQGNWYTSETFNEQINGAANAGKLLGVYHYIDGSGGAYSEMERFYSVIKPWIGKVIVCLDWEAGGNSQWGRAGYLDQCIRHIKELTGKTIFVYTGPYEYGAWNVAEAQGCRTWKAQYASNNPIYGYQDHPWNEGDYECDIRQYSGAGRLPGYNSDLDLNKSYINKNEWIALAGSAAGFIDSIDGSMDMWFIYRPNMANYLVFCDGHALHPLSHPDEVTALQTVYKNVTGKDIPMFELGTPEAPWATRFQGAIERKA